MSEETDRFIEQLKQLQKWPEPTTLEGNIERAAETHNMGIMSFLETQLEAASYSCTLKI